MYRKTFALIAILGAAALGLSNAAHAQTATFGVEARATTSGGSNLSGTDSSGWLAGVSSVSAQQDPGGVTYNNGSGLVFTELVAVTDAYVGHITAHAAATARNISAVSFGSSPYSSTEARYRDTLTVKSDTLPVGTPVTLKFHHSASVGADTEGLFDGTAQASLQVGGTLLSTRWSTHWQNGESAPFSTGDIEVQTTVGGRIYIEGKLSTYARAHHFWQGPFFNGNIGVNASSRLRLTEASAEVYLVGDSGLVLGR